MPSDVWLAEGFIDFHSIQAVRGFLLISTHQTVGSTTKHGIMSHRYVEAIENATFANLQSLVDRGCRLIAVSVRSSTRCTLTNKNSCSDSATVVNGMYAMESLLPITKRTPITRTISYWIETRLIMVNFYFCVMWSWSIWFLIDPLGKQSKNGPIWGFHPRIKS